MDAGRHARGEHKSPHADSGCCMRRGAAGKAQRHDRVGEGADLGRDGVIAAELDLDRLALRRRRRASFGLDRAAAGRAAK